MRSIGRLPGIARLAAYETADSVLARLDSTLETFAQLPSKIVRIPELEWEMGARYLVTNFKVIFCIDVMNIIETVMPIGHLSLPIPLISGCVISDLLTPDGRAKIIAACSLLSKSYGSLYPFSGKLNMDIPDYYGHEVFQHVMIKIQDLLTNTLHSAFGSLISTFNSIWTSLGLPGLPDLVSFDAESIINAFVSGVVGKGYSELQSIVTSIESIGIPVLGTVGSLLGAVDKSVYHFLNAESDLAKVIHGAKDLASKYPLLLIEQWMAHVTTFFDAIGLHALLQYIPFTFCDFLHIAAPDLLSFTS
jgi:hypothetical protein